MLTEWEETMKKPFKNSAHRWYRPKMIQIRMFNVHHHKFVYAVNQLIYHAQCQGQCLSHECQRFLSDLVFFVLPLSLPLSVLSKNYKLDGLTLYCLSESIQTKWLLFTWFSARNFIHLLISYAEVYLRRNKKYSNVIFLMALHSHCWLSFPLARCLQRCVYLFIFSLTFFFVYNSFWLLSFLFGCTCPRFSLRISHAFFYHWHAMEQRLLWTLTL